MGASAIEEVDTPEGAPRMQVEAEADYVEYISARLPRLHRTAYLLCGDPDRAEDIVQATAISVYVHWKRVSAAANVDAYVHRMLVHEYLQQKRLRWSRVLLLDRMPEAPARRGPDIEERDAVLDALAQLAKGQRAAVVLRYFADLSVEETATVLGCSTGNVKSQTARGLATLRKLLHDSHAAAWSTSPLNVSDQNGTQR
jgi:RNA polymerase sigma-70 factor (sigma-E family)